MEDPCQTSYTFLEDKSERQIEISALLFADYLTLDSDLNLKAQFSYQKNGLNSYLCPLDHKDLMI